VSPSIEVTVQVRGAGQRVGAPVTEHISLDRILTELDGLLAGQDAAQLGSVLRSMIKCAFLDEEVFRAAIAAIECAEEE
jgi:L-alanine-DL-glutamate epimerase-like enolase superfamily enzyme